MKIRYIALILMAFLILGGCFQKDEKKDAVADIVEQIKSLPSRAANEKIDYTSTGIKTGLYLKKDTAIYYYDFENIAAISQSDLQIFTQRWGNADIETSFFVFNDDKAVSVGKVRENSNSIYKAIETGSFNVSLPQFTNVIQVTTKVTDGITGLFQYATGKGPGVIFSVQEGYLTTTQSLTLSTDVQGATVLYTTEEVKPVTLFTTYSAVITLNSNVTISAVSVKSDWKKSVVKKTYKFNKIENPTFSLAGGNYNAQQKVQIFTSDSSVKVRYTLDGSNPTSTAGILYDYGSLITIEEGMTTVLKAIAFRPDYVTSQVSTVSYVISAKTATPQFTPTEGGVNAGTQVNLTCATSGASIYYTLDGTTPTTGSALYVQGTTNISVMNNVTITAIAVKSGIPNSIVANSRYTIIDTIAPTPGNSGITTLSGITETTMNVAWTAANDGLGTTISALNYKVVKSKTPDEINTVESCDAIKEGSGLVLDWTKGALTTTAAGLSSGTKYYFRVLVRDLAGNKALYQIKSDTTVMSADVTEPTTGGSGIITTSNVGEKSMNLSWNAATDNVSIQNKLKYKLVKALTTTAIDTLIEADEITTTAGGLILDWTENKLTASAIGLKASTTYSFIVLVKDEAGNKNIYTLKTQATTPPADQITPTPGAIGVITASDITETSFTLNWTSATDNVTTKTALLYKLVKAITTTAIDTVAEVEEVIGSDIIVDWTTNITSQAITGLTAGTTYNYNVIVQDETGNKAIYLAKSQKTVSPDITPPTPGASGILTSSNVTDKTMTISWTSATDDVTSPAAIKYKLVKADAAAQIDTLEEADGVTGDSLIFDWTENKITADILGLIMKTSYSFAVVVKDEKGNKSMYTVYTKSTSGPLPKIRMVKDFDNTTRQVDDYSKYNSTTRTYDKITIPNSGSPRNLIMYKDKLYFTTKNGFYSTVDGSEFIKIQSFTTANTNYYYYDDEYYGDSNLKTCAIINDKLYFITFDYGGMNNSKMYEYTGTGEAKEVKGYADSNNYNWYTPIIAYKDKLYFAKYANTQGNELCEFDGTNFKIYDLAKGSNSSNPRGFVIYKDKLYFNANYYENNKWTYNIWEVESGKEPQKSTFYTSTSNYGYGNGNMFVLGDKLYFNGEFGSGNELCVYEGTTAKMVKDLSPGKYSYADQQLSTYVYNYNAIDGKIAFSAQIRSNNKVSYKYYTYDGTNDPVEIDNLYSYNSILFNNKIYLSASKNTTDWWGNMELYEFDGKAVTLTKDINENTNTTNFMYGSRNGSNPTEFTEYKGNLYFSANDGVNGRELWVLEP